MMLTERVRVDDRPFATWVDVLRTRSEIDPAAVPYTFLTDGETQEEKVTHAELDRQARSIAAELQSRGVKPGDRALLLYAPGLEYIAGFFGCLYAGVVAVPAYPPDPGRLPRTLPRVQAIVADSRAAVVLTTQMILSMAQLVFSQAPELGKLRWIATDDPAYSVDDYRPLRIDARALAFVQYTSGSTGQPKGVMLSHHNLIANAIAISGAFEITEHSCGVSWLPPYHDMGLIGGILQPLYVGRPTVLMSPLAFLQRPMRWLEAISRARATISGAPNFAFDLCVRKATDDDCANVDLSSWQTAFCGAEPVRAETIDRFVERFEESGFRREAFYPCYGLAEATLLVSGGRRDDPPVVQIFSAAALEAGRAQPESVDYDGARALVGCGRQRPEHIVAIVDPESRQRCSEGTVGEIWVSGPSVAQGYWQLDVETEATFRGRIAGDERDYLRTGDLGFLWHGELFVTGRLKDLIVIRGRNCYPQDIELTVERAHPALRPGCGAAFAVEIANSERLIIVSELERRFLAERRAAPRADNDRRKPRPEIQAFAPPPGDASVELDFSEITQAVRAAVTETHALQPFAVVLIKAGTIPKTSSGKVQRHAIRNLFLNDALDVIHEWKRHVTSVSDLTVPRSRREVTPSRKPRSVRDVTSWLVAQLSSILRMDALEIDVTQSINRLGLDSLQAVELQNDIELTFGVVLPSATILKGPPIDSLAQLIQARSTVTQDAAIEPLGPGVQPPLSYAQERLWFLAKLDPSSSNYNISAAISMRGSLDVRALERTLNEIVRRHDSLRTTFDNVDGKPRVCIHPFKPHALPMRDLSSSRALPIGRSSRDQIETLKKRIVAEEARTPFDVENGPLIRWLLLRLSADEHLLLVTIHHIVSDGWSIGVFARELGHHYSAFAQGNASELRELSIQYQDYAAWERDRLEGAKLEEGVAYWKQRLAGAPGYLRLPPDRPRPSRQSFRGARYSSWLGAELSEKLHALARSKSVTLYQLLLAAFSVVVHRYTSAEDFVIGCVTANRNRAQLRRLIGFFANTLALRIDVSGDPDFGTVLDRVVDTTLEAYAHDYVPFEKVVEAIRPERDLSKNPLVQVVFVLQDAPIPPLELPGLVMRAEELDTQAARFDLLVAAWETSEGLVVSFEYATDLFEQATIARLGEHFASTLREVVARPDARISELGAHIPHRTLTLALAATFTADLIKTPLETWFDHLRIPTSVKLAPYNQVFQQLLEPDSLFARNMAGVNLVLLRLEDLSSAGASIDERVASMHEGVESFVSTLAAFLRASAVPCLVAVCPPSDAWTESAVASQGIQAAQRRLFDQLARVRDQAARDGASRDWVMVIDLEKAVQQYQVDRVNDPYTDELGHVPYSYGAFAAFAASIARRIFHLGSPYQAVAIDPVGTLWGRANGGQPPQATPPQRRMQSALVRLAEQGFKVCLCGPGDERETFRTLKEQRDMPLKGRHLHSWRIGREDASKKLAELADELGLTLDRLIFISADAEACRAVRDQGLGCLVVPLPEGGFDHCEIINHVWALPDPAEAAVGPGRR